MDSKKTLNSTIQELETQRKRLYESVEEWALKGKKLKAVNDELQVRNDEISAQLRDQHEKTRELNKALELAKLEI